MKISYRILSLILALVFVVPVIIGCFPIKSEAAGEQLFLSELYLYYADDDDDAEEMYKGRVSKLGLTNCHLLQYDGEPADLNDGCGLLSDYILISADYSTDVHKAIRGIRLLDGGSGDGSESWTDPNTGAVYYFVKGVELLSDGDPENIPWGPNNADYINSKYYKNEHIGVNFGAGAKTYYYLFVSYDLAAGDPITSVKIVHDDEGGENLVQYRNGGRADFNKTAGGDTIGMAYSTKITGTVKWYNVYWHKSDSSNSAYETVENVRYMPDTAPDYGFKKDDFGGWYYDLNFSKEYKPGEEIGQDVHLYPKLYHYITFDSDGGTPVEPLKYTINQYPRSLSKEFNSKSWTEALGGNAYDYKTWAMQKKGYIFKGWTTGKTTDYKATWVNMYRWFLRQYGSAYYMQSPGKSDSELIDEYNKIKATGSANYLDDANELAKLVAFQVALSKRGYEYTNGEFVKSKFAYKPVWEPTLLTYLRVQPDEIIDIMMVADEDVVYGLYNYLMHSYTPETSSDLSRDSVVKALDGALQAREKYANTEFAISKIAAFAGAGESYVNNMKSKLSNYNAISIISNFYSLYDNAKRATRRNTDNYKLMTEFYLTKDWLLDRGYSPEKYYVTSPSGFIFINSYGLYLEPDEEGYITDDIIIDAYYHCIMAYKGKPGYIEDEQMYGYMYKDYYKQVLNERGYTVNSKKGTATKNDLAGTVMGETSWFIYVVMGLTVATGAIIAVVRTKKMKEMN